MGSQAKLENDNKGVNVSRGLRTAVEHGRWPGLAPLGYENQYRTDKKGVLRLDPVRAPMIQQMFEKVAYDRMSVRKVFKWLRDEAGFKTRKGKTWSLSSVYRALQSPFYYGMIEYPRKSGRWFKGLHIPLITKALFDEVQMIITVEPAVKIRHEFAFTRLIKCGYCGSGICAVQKLKTLKSGMTVQYIYYSCSRGADHFCKAPSIREEDLLTELERIIDEIQVDELGMKTRFEAEIKRFTMFQNDILNKSDDQSSPQPTIDLKTYAKYILRNGSISEKRELLASMKSRLELRNGRLTLAH